MIIPGGLNYVEERQFETGKMSNKLGQNVSVARKAKTSRDRDVCLPAKPNLVTIAWATLI